MKTFAERLNTAMIAAGVSQGQLAEMVGVSQPAIQKMTSGKTNGSRKMVELANALGVRPEWLSSGQGAMREDGQQPQSQLTKTGDSDVFRLDVLDLTVSAGPGIINQEFVEILHSVEYAPAEARHMFDGRKAENIRIINVRGDSMSGTIEPGDLLFVDISVKSFDGDGIYAFLYDDTAHVKRLQKMKDKLLVISDNKIYTPWDPIEKDEMNRVFVFGKVIGSMPQTYRKHG
ncbi:helix-turn-helix transcriptional regulator [Klebsiella michiganensis]|uniref:XRE family transcriptional regulator n=1 Tax=Klebsiella michiganensis TaxID=1134687 RepID=UPI0007DABA87|nr:helix-turn-helix transcriptional regulator [Klebsiella michiganensis]MBA4429918.1 helix-turn-helix transcriptional regulator [Klebsiella michiganensis]HBK4624717.1 helix-turn-helix transcriptional regulator [Klebsiella michiganensis]HBK4647452.1 helix-turn-helix transcriptional regulator [Klebsiella michiganensis]HBK4653534.1 helix-turn-helix transcriptional regulator [Klebsiella michiganensis]